MLCACITLILRANLGRIDTPITLTAESLDYQELERTLKQLRDTTPEDGESCGGLEDIKERARCLTTTRLVKMYEGAGFRVAKDHVSSIYDFVDMESTLGRVQGACHLHGRLRALHVRPLAKKAMWASALRRHPSLGPTVPSTRLP